MDSSTTDPSAAWHGMIVRDPAAAKLWLGGVGVRDVDRGSRALRGLAGHAGSEATARRLVGQFDAVLPRCPDSGMALANLERFVEAKPDPAAVVLHLSENLRTLEVLTQLFSTSQHFSEIMIGDPSLFDWLRGGARRLDRLGLLEELETGLREARGEEDKKLALRRFRRRELLRIGHDDIVKGAPLEQITLDLSVLAEVCVEGAHGVARGRVEARFGAPRGRGGKPARFVVLALGKLGGLELNYSSDIDLIFLYDQEGVTDGPRTLSNAEFHARMGGEIVRLLADHTDLGVAYRVDMRLRPEGDQGELARTMESALGYYETSGRTWERQALIKCRPIAGDLELGREFLEAITPFVFRRYLSAAEIGEIKAMKRRIEQRTLTAGTSEVEVKTGHGGIRDVEFVVQFLQLLHGGQYPEVRHPNTLISMSRLEQVGCLTADERAIMEGTYRFLRQVEHRLQTMFDRQTHEMPRDLEEQRILAVRMGYPPASPWEDRTGPAQRFLADYRAKTDLNRRILNHLLHDAFRDETGTAADPVVDLVLDPNPSPEAIVSVLARYPFRDRNTAYQNLMALARENFRFLSQARCHHFLAAIAPRLLQAVGQTPDPDLALTNLEKVSASLGAKAVLWELFSYNPPTLRLFVEICATSQFLSEILINNPGMIDDLMDSLVADRAQPSGAIKAELGELCKGAEDLGPILLSFRNKEWMRIGVRDILERESIRDVTRELSDVAAAIVSQAAHDQWLRKGRRHGLPARRSDGQRARWAILGMGKFGGRELNYHSDLDLVFVLQEDGMTAGGAESISNEQFASDVVRRLIRALDDHSGFTLYHIDTRLRPHGASGPLVVTLEAFRDYYRRFAGVWERLALTRARVVYSTGSFGRILTDAIREILLEPLDRSAIAREVIAMRNRLSENTGRLDLKRGHGKIAEIEFIVQYLELVNAAENPEVLHPNAWNALDALRRRGHLGPEIHADLRDAYEFWRTVESRLRIVHNRGASELPESTEELTRLALHLNYAGPGSIEAFQRDAERHSTRVHSHFEWILGSAADESRVP